MLVSQCHVNLGAAYNRKEGNTERTQTIQWRAKPNPQTERSCAGHIDMSSRCVLVAPAGRQTARNIIQHEASLIGPFDAA